MKALVWATIDTLSCLLLVVLAAINPPIDPAKAAIETYGRWAIVVTWPAGNNDVDTWYRAPDGSKVWFAESRSAVAHLESDDLGSLLDEGGVNRERMVIRSVLPGEHIVNLHAYDFAEPPVIVNVELWRLQGNDRRVHRETITLQQTGEEVTVFRFRLSESGALQEMSRLPARLVAPL